MITTVLLLMISQTTTPQRPVIRLDDALLQGTYKRPSMIELESTELNEKVQALALKNLIELEKELTKPNPRPTKTK
jgi:hypothetical protein